MAKFDLKKIIQALSKSGDDVTEEAILKNAQKEAQDIVQPLGSGKNLDALFAAKKNAVDAEVLANKPYPKNITQDELAQRDNFKLIGEPTSKDFTLPHPEATPPVIYKPNDLTSPEISKTFEAQIGGITEEMKKKMDPRILKALGIGTAATIGGGVLMSGGDTPVPPQSSILSKKSEPEKESGMPEDYMQKAQAEALNQTSYSQQPKIKPNDAKVQEEASRMEETLDAKQTEAPQSSFEQMLMDAQRQSDMRELGSNFARYGELIGAGFARVAPNHTVSEALSKQIDKPVKDMTARIGAKKEQQSYDRLNTELQDEKSNRDPNSTISQAFREAYQYSTGKSLPAGTTAKQLLDMGFNGSSLISAKIAADSRRDTRELMMDEKRTKMGRLSEKQQSGITEFDTTLSNLDNIVGLLGEKGEYVGPIDSKFPNFMVGEDLSSFRSAVGRMQDAYRKLITGAGASSLELQKLESRLPNDSDNPKQFKAKANEFKKEVQRAKNIYLKNLQKSGKNVEEFSDVPVQQESVNVPITTGYSAKQEKAIEHVMTKNNVSREQAIGALKKARKL